jgi:RNA polymerase sigma-70 factor, ECF subfamily
LQISDLYDACAPKLQRHARYLASNGDEADDLVQDTFVRAMGHLSTLADLPPGKREAWLYRTLRNLFIDRRRMYGREAKLQEAFTEHLSSELSANTAPVVWVSVPEILARVPERDRELLRLRYVTGMTSHEIGSRLGIPAATVRSRLHTAIRRLRSRRSRFAD